MKNRIDEELNELTRTLVKMCGDANGAMRAVSEHIGGKDCEREALEIEESVKTRKSEAEARCVRLLVLHQPVAKDLRRVKTALSVIVDLSRIAEQARHITELSAAFGGYARPVFMCATVQDMVKSACESYLAANQTLAATVEKADDRVDETYAAIRAELVEVLRSRTADGDDWPLDCLLTAKYLERIADHAVRIAASVSELV